MARILLGRKPFKPKLNEPIHKIETEADSKLLLVDSITLEIKPLEISLHALTNILTP
ncbi:unnamed protein product [Dovyalis caffra]|uniref:Uncharacterized protein n=1 Tax=Dovyalis caffra TaxID=77055 RepID=A0AAV1SR18_9ROSI|nr:unnamed protein product [Dovyalis caffra]